MDSLWLSQPFCVCHRKPFFTYKYFFGQFPCRIWRNIHGFGKDCPWELSLSTSSACAARDFVVPCFWGTFWTKTHTILSDLFIYHDSSTFIKKNQQFKLNCCSETQTNTKSEHVQTTNFQSFFTIVFNLEFMGKILPLNFCLGNDEALLETVIVPESKAFSKAFSKGLISDRLSCRPVRSALLETSPPPWPQWRLPSPAQATTAQLARYLMNSPTLILGYKFRSPNCGPKPISQY